MLRTLALLTLTGAAAVAQTPTVTSVYNAYSYSTTLCPGLLAVVVGTNFGTDYTKASVTVNGKPAYVYHTVLGHPRKQVMRDAFLGPEYSDEEIERFLVAKGVPYRRYDREGLLRESARLIADQKVLGWFQGRMEFGPRALGARSILADARNPKNQSVVNLKIKFRESFRPFAPTVLEERTPDYFEWKTPSPFMLFVATVRADKRDIPAVTHVDGSARLQTIARDQHPLYYDLLAEFERQTGCPVIINTSFNQRGEPIVCTPENGFSCFLRTGMDHLVIGSFILNKEEMSRELLDEAAKQEFEPD